MDHQIVNSVGGRYQGTLYEGKSWSYHFHNSFELIYVFAGHMTVTVNDRAVPLSADEFFLISPSMAHRIDSDADCRFFIAIFAEDYVPEMAGEENQSAYYRFSLSGTDLALLREHLLVAGTPDRYRLRACLYTVCAHARRTEGEMPVDGRGHFVYEVNRYLSEHVTREIRRRDLATALNYEEHYFSSLFLKHFGIGFKKYLNIYRFSLAQQMLLVTDRSTADIALSCGFSGTRSFHAVFHALSGQTPSEYRRERLSGMGAHTEREGEKNDA